MVNSLWRKRIIKSLKKKLVSGSNSRLTLQYSLLFLFFFFLTSQFLILNPRPCHAANIEVTTNADGDPAPAGSLRWAMTTANGNAQADTISFTSTVTAITPTSQLPTLSENFATTIDGANVVTINGNGVNFHGFEITSAGNQIKGLIIRGFSGVDKAGVHITGASATNNTILGNKIGNDGTTAYANYYGIWIDTGANNNIIGGTTPGERNIISGNSSYGVIISGTNNNQVKGNYIGTNTAGTAALANLYGVYIEAGAQSNKIGGTVTGEGNTIAFNTNDGVWVDGAATDNNKISRNVIHSNGGLGIDLSPDGVTANDIDDVDTGPNQNLNFPVITSVVQTATDVYTVSGTAPANATIEIFRVNDTVSGVNPDATGYGEAFLFLNSVTSDAVSGDWSIAGITITGGTYVTATTTDTSGNTSEFAKNMTLNTIVVTNTNNTGNGSLRQAITNANLSTVSITITFTISSATITPASQLPSLSGGDITIDGTGQNITIDGAAAAFHGFEITSANNVIKGLAIIKFSVVGYAGVHINGASATGNTISGNKIGNNGTTAYANGYGILIDTGAPSNIIGGTTAVERNIISGNTSYGVYITGAGTNSNVVKGNYIGTDVNGTAALANQYGVYIGAGAQSNTIGGTAAGAGNVISGNSSSGVYITGSGTNLNVVKGNYIGTKVNGTDALGNGGDGVKIDAGAQSNIIGGTAAGEANIIAFNSYDGVWVDGDTTDKNKISGNKIHSSGGLGIDLSPNGVTANDTGDVDTGPNENLNFPVITSILGTAPNYTVVGTAPASSTVEIFRVNDTASSVNPDSTGYGEAYEYRDFATADVNGNWSKLVTISGGSYITATATDSVGNTSEFAKNVVLGTIVVTNNSNSGSGSLRQAIIDVNATSGSNTITFAISSQTITPLITQLPALSDATGGTTIDGTGQNITIDGNGAGFHGFEISSANNVIKGLLIIKFSGLGYAGVHITGASATGNTISGNKIGNNGTTAYANYYGILIDTGAPSNIIGGITAEERNIISGNTNYGVYITGAGTNSNVIKGNYIGTDVNGTAAIVNGSGVYIGAGAQSNIIGGTTAGERNVISGNSSSGVYITGSGTNSNVVKGNYIGTKVNGTAALANSYGIYILAGAQNNTIGGTTAGERNIISGNTSYGVYISGTSTNSNVVKGNYIGTDVNGTAAIVNGSGVYIGTGAQSNIVGGTTAGERNIISGNTGSGVYIENTNTNNNQVQGNYIGTDVNGTSALANGKGIYIRDSAQSNIIGGGTDSYRNVVSGNTSEGLLLDGVNTKLNEIKHNYIGVKSTGSVSLPNGVNYITERNGASDNLKCSNKYWNGSAITTDGNCTIFVTNNSDTGAGSLRQAITDANANSGADPIAFTISSQTIIPLTQLPTLNDATGGTTINGTGQNITIDGNGVTFDGFKIASANNVIKGLTIVGFSGLAGEPAGVHITGASAINNIISGNKIGNNGTVANANYYGILIDGGAGNNIIGGTTAGERNIISGNTSYGVNIKDANTKNNVVKGNYIGTNEGGTAALGNSYGIYIWNGAQSNIIGGATAEEINTISGNTNYGVYISGAGTDSNMVRRNYIGTNKDGLIALANGKGVGIFASAKSNIIGGGTDSCRNVVSGNTNQGILLDGAGTESNQIKYNYIGIKSTGSESLPNGVVYITEQNGAANNEKCSNTYWDGLVKQDTSCTGVSTHVTIAGDDGAGSLRWAIINANANPPATITFAGNLTIIPLTQLPTLTGGNITIDGSGYTIVIDGNGANFNGFEITSAGNTIKNLTIKKFSVDPAVAIHITGFGATNNTVSGTKIGNDGTLGQANFGGILIENGAQGNVIGGTTIADRNVISGNTNYGVCIRGASTNNNVVKGNYVGTNGGGATALANKNIGVYIQGAHHNTIGGTTEGERNIISGNTNYGVYITGTDAKNNEIKGNYIGTNKDGILALANGCGLRIDSGAQSNTIGGAASGERNVISGNTNFGVYIKDTNTRDNKVKGNYIGTDAGGTTALANDNGIYICLGAQSNIIGGITAGERNIISGNSSYGVYITGVGADSNVVKGNYIGTKADGTIALANSNGVFIGSGAKSNIVGGGSPGEGNIVSGNTNWGIYITDTGTDSNKVKGNYIGANVNGTAALANGKGVLIGNGAQSNVIGADGDGISDAGERNVISGNSGYGVYITDLNTEFNKVQGNYIGTDVNGTAALANGSDGIHIYSGAKRNIIGTDSDGVSDNLEKNVISGNTGDGVVLRGANTNLNEVKGNYIGTNVNGTTALANGTLANGSGGIYIYSEAQSNIIGTDGNGVNDAGEMNVISGNKNYGVYIKGVNTNNNLVKGNYIGTDVNGTVALANGSDGVRIEGGAQSNVVGGAVVGERNIISGNTKNGVYITGNGTNSNLVKGNYLGTNKNGSAPLANETGLKIDGGAQNNTIGGAVAGERNIISKNTNYGVYISGTSTNSNVVKGNYIGTDVGGTLSLANGSGVYIGAGAQSNIIGGTAAGERNVISGNSGSGVYITGLGTNGNEVKGNYIGVKVGGTEALANGGDGIKIDAGAQSNIIGGTAAGEGNTIAFNTNDGVWVDGDATDKNKISGNDIYSNGGLGIDLSPNGVTANDTGDVDIGPNENLNFPVITSISGTAPNYTVSGTAPANSTVEIFQVDNAGATPVIGADSSGQGEGCKYLAFTVADVSGSFGPAVVNVPVGSSYITATATDLSGNTSEFAQNVALIVVTNTNSDGVGSLKQAIIDANNSKPITITFAISNATISPLSQLPALAQGKVIVNGTGQNITINGNGASFNGFEITSADNTIKGLTIINFSGGTAAGIHISGATATGNTISGNKIGNNGTTAQANYYGILIDTGAGDVGLGQSNIIGGTTAEERNIISGNINCGVYITGLGTESNKVRGNYIGTDVNGTTALANGSGVSVGGGVKIGDKAKSNIIGTDGDGVKDVEERNIISGNTCYGVYITDLGTDSNKVQGNYIGTNVGGTSSLANKYGVYIGGGAGDVAQGNKIGTDGNGTSDAQERNLISGNTDSGVYITGSGTDNNEVRGNYIGTGVDGTTALANKYGLYISGGAQSNEIGTDGNGVNDAAERNIISGNDESGVYITGLGTDSNEVKGNYIGTKVDGTSALANGVGIWIKESAKSNIIGGTGAASEANIIAFNTNDGVWVEGDATDKNKMSRNKIHSNGGLGIDLSPDGVTANDTGDVDTGPNENLNFPVIVSVLQTATNVYKVEGTALAGAVVELFRVNDTTAGVSAEPLGYGEAYEYLATITADGSGNFTFVGITITGGTLITATATDANGNTSEFAKNQKLDMIPPAPITNVTLSDTPGDSGGSLTVGWGANTDSDFKQYNIYISTSAITNVTGMTTEKTISTQSTTTTVITTIGGVAITNGLDYYVAVTAVDKMDNEEKAVTDAGPVKPIDNNPTPDPITNVTLSDTPNDSGGSLTVSWGANTDSDFKQYNIYISTSAITTVTGRTAEKTISTQSTTTTVITTIGGVAITDGVDYYVAVTAVDTSGQENKTVTDAGPAKSYATAATPTAEPLPSGISVVSVPIDAISKDPKDMFGISAEDLAGNLCRWKPDESKYLCYPDTFVKEIEPGEGFWLNLTASKTVSIDGILQVTELQIPLLVGWNQIGNPFNSNIAWDDSKIKVEKAGVTKTLRNAAIEGWVCIYAWAYDPASGSYQLVHPDIPNALSNLEPWGGYWVKANENCKLIIPKTLAKAKEEAPLEEVSEDNWSLQLIAEVEEVKDTFNYLGVSESKIKIGEPPPPILPSISLYFLEGKERYALDYRQPSEAKAWDFVVKTALKDKEITLSWNLSRVPPGYEFVLYDTEENQEIDLSLSNSYKYNSKEGGERHFQIGVKSKLLTVSVLKVFNYPNPFSGGTTIRVELSSAVDSVSAEIYTISGEKIKDIPSFSGVGIYEADWNGVNDFGERVANGVYIYVVTIRDSAGNEKRVTKKMAVIK